LPAKGVHTEVCFWHVERIGGRPWLSDRQDVVANGQMHASAEKLKPSSSWYLKTTKQLVPLLMRHALKEAQFVN